MVKEKVRKRAGADQQEALPLCKGYLDDTNQRDENLLIECTTKYISLNNKISLNINKYCQNETSLLPKTEPNLMNF